MTTEEKVQEVIRKVCNERGYIVVAYAPDIEVRLGKLIEFGLDAESQCRFTMSQIFRVVEATDVSDWRAQHEAEKRAAAGFLDLVSCEVVIKAGYKYFRAYTD